MSQPRTATAYDSITDAWSLAVSCDDFVYRLHKRGYEISPIAQARPAVASDHDCLMPSACGVTGFYCSNADRPPVASEGLRAALFPQIAQHLQKVARDTGYTHPEYLSGHEYPPTDIPCLPETVAEQVVEGHLIEADRAALASGTGSVGALDVERLARALKAVRRGQDREAGKRVGYSSNYFDTDAAAIAAAYDAERQGEK